MKLEIELVPNSLWYLNLRKMLPQKEWDKIRFETYAKYNNCCGICGAKIKLNCHEIWEYDDINHIQKLKGFIALCDNCHMIKHIGFAGIQADKGLLDMDQLINHFIKVNNVNKEEFENHKEKSFKLWKERSTFDWTVDYGDWKNLLEKNKFK
jgi:hypothetical protein